MVTEDNRDRESLTIEELEKALAEQKALHEQARIIQMQVNERIAAQTTTYHTPGGKGDR